MDKVRGAEKIADLIGEWPRCPFCGTLMRFRRDHPHKTTENGVTIWAVDVLMKCPKCYFVATFGIPLSQEEYQRRQETVQETKRRLETLGYFPKLEA